MATIRICGIYKITNTMNGKCYIGQSVNIEKRWEYYKYGTKDNTPILYAIRKHGLNNFKFEVVEECSIESINTRERYWIDRINSLSPNGYNLSTGGRKTTWTYRPSAETLKKRSIALTGKKRTEETKRKMSESQKGRKVSPEIVEKIRQANLGKKPWNKGTPMSDNAKKKLSESKTGKPSTWRRQQLKRSDGKIFESIAIAAEQIGANRATICKHLAGKLKTVHGFTFERVAV